MAQSTSTTIPAWYITSSYGSQLSVGTLSGFNPSIFASSFSGSIASLTGSMTTSFSTGSGGGFSGGGGGGAS